jgi:hypothetical protein
MTVFQEGVAKKEINGTDCVSKVQQGKKSVKNMEKCAYNTGYDEWLCVRMTMRIMQ